MAWEDLEEDLAAEFSDGRTERFDGFQLFHRPSRESLDRTDLDRIRAMDRESKARARARRREAALETGARLSRCARDGCCNLLSPKPKVGRAFVFCDRGCCIQEYSRRARVARAHRKAGTVGGGVADAGAHE